MLATDAGDLTVFRAWLKSERGFEPPEDWDLFTIDIDALTVISADGGQLRAWQATYRGVMPDAYLDELDVDDRAAFWRRQVLALLPGQRLKVIVDDGVVVGFAAAGPEHDGRAAGVGELYAINLDPQVWSRGLGRALLRDVTVELAGLGCREAVLWVVPQNDRARRFYESEQWCDDHVRRDDEVFGVVVPEMRYRRPLPTSGPGVSDNDVG